MIKIFRNKVIARLHVIRISAFVLVLFFTVLVFIFVKPDILCLEKVNINNLNNSWINTLVKYQYYYKPTSLVISEIKMVNQQVVIKFKVPVIVSANIKAMLVKKGTKVAEVQRRIFGFFNPGVAISLLQFPKHFFTIHDDVYNKSIDYLLLSDFQNKGCYTIVVDLHTNKIYTLPFSYNKAIHTSLKLLNIWIFMERSVKTGFIFSFIVWFPLFVFDVIKTVRGTKRA